MRECRSPDICLPGKLIPLLINQIFLLILLAKFVEVNYVESASKILTHMKRRDALKTMMLATGGALAFPSWAMGWNKNSIPLTSNIFTESEQAILSSIVDTILPSNGTLGGISLGVDTFMAGLISECYEPEVQTVVKARFQMLDEKANDEFGKDFTNCSASDREKLLLSFSESSVELDQEFFKFMKEQAIRGFETSEIVMVEYHGYEIMPGHFFGCVDVQEK